jgi:hypothetical protein
MATKTIGRYEALAVAERIGVDWGLQRFGTEQFQMGLDIELKCGAQKPLTSVTDDDLILAGENVLAHLNEYPDFYTRLAKMKAAGETGLDACTAMEP